MDLLLQDLVLTNIKVLGVINLLIITVAIIHRAYKAVMSEYSARFQEELWPRVQSYLKSASTARHIPTIDLRPNERQHVYDVLLSYSSYYGLDLHEIFDINGFTRERIERLWTRKNAQLLRELAVIKSPQAQDLLFARLSETSGEEAYRVANTLAAVKMNEANQKRLVRTMLKAGINVDRSVEIIAGLNLSAGALMEILYEQEEAWGEKIMLSALALQDELDQDWIVEDVRPYLFHSRDVAVAAINVLGSSGIPYAFDLLRDQYYSNPSWEVRAGIARVMAWIDPYMAIPMLKAIAADQVWWVQFNAMASLLKMGAGGREAILELSMDTRNPVASSLARQVLDRKPVARPRFKPAFSEPARAGEDLEDRTLLLGNGARKAGIPSEEPVKESAGKTTEDGVAKAASEAAGETESKPEAADGEEGGEDNGALQPSGEVRDEQ